MAKATTPIASRGEARNNNEHDHGRQRGHVHVPGAVFVFGALCVLLCASAGLVIAPRAQAQIGVGGIDHAPPDDARMEIVGWWGGPIRDVAVEDDISAIAVGTRLVLLNVSDKSNPLRMAEKDLGFEVLDVELRNGYAFVITNLHIPYGNDHSFLILDVSQPSEPEMVFHFAYDDGWGSGGKFYEVELYGQYAYVLNVFGNMEIFDVSEPRNTSHIGQFEWVDLGTSPIETIIEGQYLFALDDADFFQIFDLGFDPLDPRLESSLRVDGDVTAMSVEGDYLVVTAGALFVYDISRPWDPFLAGSADDLTNPVDVSLSNGYAVLADHTIVGWTDGQPWWNLSKGLAIYDILTDPSMPELVGTLKTHGTTRGLEVIGATAYTFDDGEGLVLVDVADPSNPQRLGQYYSPTTLRHMDKVSDLLYVTDEWNGFTVLDVADPTRPEAVGIYQVPELGKANHFGIGMSGDWALLAGGYSGVHVVDVSDPSNPERAWHYPTIDGRGTFGVEIDGAVARIGVDRDLVNFDIESLPILKPLGQVQVLGGAPYEIATTDAQFSHIARSRHVVVDNSVPEFPEQCRSDLSVRAVDIAISRDYAFAAHLWGDEDGGGFYIRDIGDGCAMPVTVWYYPADRALVAGLMGSKAFFGATSDPSDEPPTGPTLVHFDISDPRSPILLSKLRVRGLVPWTEFGGLWQDGSRDLLAENDIVYVTTHEGLAVISVGALKRAGTMSALRR